MNSKRKIVIAGFVSGILFFAFGMIMIFPVWRSITRGSQHLVSQRNELTQITFLEQQAKSFSRFFREHKPELDAFENLFVNAQTPIDFIVFLENTAEDSQVSLDISLGTPQKFKEDLWSSLNVQVSGEGSYHAFFTFLKKMEYAPYLLQMGNLNVNKIAPFQKDLSVESKAVVLDRVKFSLTLKAYTK